MVLVAGTVTRPGISPALVIRLLYEHILYTAHIPLGLAFYWSPVLAFRWRSWEPVACLYFGNERRSPSNQWPLLLGFLFSFWIGFDLQAAREGRTKVFGQRVVRNAHLRLSPPEIQWCERRLPCPWGQSSLWGMTCTSLVPHKSLVQRCICWRLPFYIPPCFNLFEELATV